MKLSKQKVAILVSCAVMLLGVVLTVLRWQIEGFLPFFSHPIWALFLVVTLGLGVMYTVFAFLSKTPVNFFIAGICLAAALAYILGEASLDWWLVLIIVVVLLIIVSMLSIFVNDNKTESSALNEQPDYKNYQERNQEREEKEKVEQENTVLPEIKSFKD